MIENDEDAQQIQLLANIAQQDFIELENSNKVLMKQQRFNVLKNFSKIMIEIIF